MAAPTPNYSLVTDLQNTLLNAATGTGAGLAYAVPWRPTGGLYSNFVWQVNVSGVFSGISVTLEGSNDGTNWSVLDTNTNTSGGARAVVATPVFFVRANCGTFTGGTSVTVLLSVGGQ